MSFVLSKKNQNLNQYSLLSNIEDHVEQLKACSAAIKDDNVALLRFCATFEEILREGSRRSVLLFKKKDYWQWVSAIPSAVRNCDSNDPKLTYVVGAVDTATKSWPLETKGRQFIRMALMKKCLHSPIEHLAKYKNIIQGFYTDSSFLANAYLRDSLLEHLKEVSTLEFDLNLKAMAFLNETWVIPIQEDILTVPCTQLGMTISQVEGRAVIAHILPESVAQENNIQVGDCLLGLCGKSCWNQKVGQVVTILKSNQGQPIPMTIAKIQMPNGNFLPLEERQKLLEDDEYFLQKLGQHNTIKASSYSYHATPVHGTPKGQLRFEAKYLGSVNTGRTGDLTLIEPSILDVMKEDNKPIPVTVNLCETSIEVYDKETNKILSTHSYTVTSACGRGKEHKEVFAYISGDTTCTISRNFTCYVYTVASEAVAKEAVYGIAQGFGRTLWYV